MSNKVHTYPAFNADARCPKCRCQNISMKYFKSGITGDCSPGNNFDSYPERFRRTCTQCEYFWFEECKTEEEATT